MPEVCLHLVLRLEIKQEKVFFIALLTLKKNETVGLMSSQRLNIVYWSQRQEKIDVGRLKH